MTRVMSFAAVAAVVVVALAGVALAAGPGMGYGPGWGGGGPGPMGHGWGRMMGGQGPQGGCPMWQGGGRPGGPWGAQGPGPQEQITEDRAREIAQEYAGKYYAGFTIERVVPFQGRFRTAYQVEMKGPKGETRYLHVNPWGGVRPFGGPLATN